MYLHISKWNFLLVRPESKSSVVVNQCSYMSISRTAMIYINGSSGLLNSSSSGSVYLHLYVVGSDLAPVWHAIEFTIVLGNFSEEELLLMWSLIILAKIELFWWTVWRAFVVLPFVLFWLCPGSQITFHKYQIHLQIHRYDLKISYRCHFSHVKQFMVSYGYFCKTRVAIHRFLHINPMQSCTVMAHQFPWVWKPDALYSWEDFTTNTEMWLQDSY